MHDINDDKDHEIDNTFTYFDKSWSSERKETSLRIYFEHSKTDENTISLANGDPTICKEFGISPYGYEPYVCSSGLFEARSAISEYLTTFNINISPDSIITTSGTSQSIDLILALQRLSRGGNVMIPLPGFPLFKFLCDSRNLTVTEYQLDKNFKVTKEALEAAYTKDTRVIIINSPGNPAGNILTMNEIHIILEFCEKYSILPLSDEVYAGIVWKSPFISMASVLSNIPVAIVGSLSKTHSSPGIRFGWVAVKHLSRCPNLKKLLIASSTLVLSPSTVCQRACIEIIKYPLDYTVELMKRANMIKELLSKYQLPIEYIEPEGGLFALIRLSENICDVSL